MAQTPLLDLRRVSKTFQGADGHPLSILQDLDLQADHGERLAIVGPSGSGKSTLLNILGALDRPTSGTIHFDGRDLAELDDLALATFRNRSIGFIFQGHHLLPHCTVVENVLVPTLPHPDAELRRTAPARALELLRRVGLGERAHHKPAQLSGGEKQRAAVVRALINQPKLLLADEPTGALDRQSAATLAELLVQLNEEEKTTLIVVTHAPDLAARMSRTLELQDKRLAPSRV